MTGKMSGVSPHMFMETMASPSAGATMPRTSSSRVRQPEASTWQTARLTGPEGESVSRSRKPARCQSLVSRRRASTRAA